MIGPSDVAVSAATLPGIRISAASVRGVQHRAEHTVRQDAFALAQAGGTQAVAVVCDGVGSLDRSDYAAALVSQQLAGYGAAGKPWPEAFEAANAQLAKVAAEWEATGFGAMATTAVAVSVSRLDGWWLGEVAWVGDSPLWHLDDDGTWRSVTPAGDADSGRAFHSSSVRPMPTSDGGMLLVLVPDPRRRPLRDERRRRQPAGLEHRGACHAGAVVGAAAGPAHLRGAGRLRQEVAHGRPDRRWDLA